MAMIKVYAVRHKDEGIKGEIIEIENSLDSLQHFVASGSHNKKGLIQIVPVTSKIDCTLHDEGKFIGLPPTLAWMINGEPVDILVGDVLFCRHDSDGNSISIHDEDIEEIKKIFIPVLGFKGNVLMLEEWKDE